MSESVKPKLFLISPMLHQGGFERVCITTARLLEDVFDVSIVIFSDANIAYDITGLNIVNLDVPTKKGRINKAVNVLKRISALKKLIAKEDPTVVYSFGPTASLVNVLTKKKARTWVGLRNYTDLNFTRQMQLFVKRADAIICCSKEIEATVRSKYSFDNAYTLYNLYDVEKIKEDSEGELIEWPFGEDKRHTIVAMGRDDDQKCYWHMIKAFKLAHDKVNEARLVILGAGFFDKYKEMANALGLSDSIYFAGMRKDPYKFLKRSGIYLMTSYNEGFPNALVEGMSLGLATISTNCLTGPAEILLSADDMTVERADELIEASGSYLKADYGILIPLMGNNRDLDISNMSEEVICADALVELLKDDALYAEYGERAKARAKDFTYDAYKKTFLDIYHKDIKNGL